MWLAGYPQVGPVCGCQKAAKQSQGRFEDHRAGDSYDEFKCLQPMLLPPCIATITLISKKYPDFPYVVVKQDKHGDHAIRTIMGQSMMIAVVAWQPDTRRRPMVTTTESPRKIPEFWPGPRLFKLMKASDVPKKKRDTWVCLKMLCTPKPNG